MSDATLLPVLAAALFAGLLGSGHCFGMCGGIAGGLGSLGDARGRSFRPALEFNIGRLASYCLLGGLAALLLGAGGEAVNLPVWGRYLRLFTALLIAMIGFQFLFGWRLLDGLEKLGGKVWQRVLPMAVRAAAHPGPGGRFLLGICWGLLPCGLVYTLLLTAASTGSFAPGALVMLAFGLGTLPAMLGLTMAAPSLLQFMAEPFTRRLVGGGLLMLAIWAAWLALAQGQNLHH